MHNTKYFVKLLKPYVNKYGNTTSVNKKIYIKHILNNCLTKLYKNFTDIKTPDDFTELDFVKKHKKVLFQYGHGSGEYELVPCKLFKETIFTIKHINEI